MLSGLSIGLCHARALHEREKALVDLKLMLQALKTGISYTARPLAELIAEIEDSSFCRIAAESPCLHTEPKAALVNAGNSILHNKPDRKLFTTIVTGLGESDTDGQLEHLELCASLLENSLLSAKADSEKKSKLYVCMGLFFSIILCLVLL